VPGALSALAAIASNEMAAPIGQQLAAHLRDDPHFGQPAAQAALLMAPAELATLPFDDVFARLRNLVALAATPGDGFLREASARVFDCLSKVLDGRSDFVAGLVGSACPWRETPIPLIVAAPSASLLDVVFVENLTTFERLRLARSRFPGTAFIYSSGVAPRPGRAQSPVVRASMTDP
jgi:hypothetical protein